MSGPDLADERLAPDVDWAMLCSAAERTNVTGLARASDYELVQRWNIATTRRWLCAAGVYYSAIRSCGLPLPDGLEAVGAWPPGALLPDGLRDVLRFQFDVLNASPSAVLDIRAAGGELAEQFSTGRRMDWAIQALACGDDLAGLVRRSVFERSEVASHVWVVTDLAWDLAEWHGFDAQGYAAELRVFPQLPRLGDAAYGTLSGATSKALADRGSRYDGDPVISFAELARWLVW